MKRYLIRTYLRSDLERFLNSGTSAFTNQEIYDEIKRRDEFSRLLNSQPEKYQELSPAFH